MNVNVRLILAGVSMITLVAFATRLSAQQRSSTVPSRVSAYDTSRETVIQGTVLDYKENSGRAPLGAHVKVQTLAGPMDVHLGSASYLHANNFSLAPGDSVRLIGASIPANKGNVFLARIVLKGSQAITIRSPRGFPLAGHASRTVSEGERVPATQQARPR